MMDVRSIALDGSTLVVKGKMMGAMAATLLVSPEDVWAAFKLLPTAAKLRLPVLLYKGWRASVSKPAA